MIVGLALAMRGAGWTNTTRAADWLIRYRSHHEASTTAGVFVAGWALLTTFAFPALPLILAGGALFGTFAGTALSLVGTALGALGGYTVARWVSPPGAADWLARRAAAARLSPRATFWTLVRLRMMPVIPFGAVNFAAGAARVPLRTYMATTLVGQFPSTILYAHLADRVLAAALNRRGALWEVVAVSLGLAVVAVIGGVWGGRREDASEAADADASARTTPRRRAPASRRASRRGPRRLRAPCSPCAPRSRAGSRRGHAGRRTASS